MLLVVHRHCGAHECWRDIRHCAQQRRACCGATVGDDTWEVVDDAQPLHGLATFEEQNKSLQLAHVFVHDQRLDVR